MFEFFYVYTIVLYTTQYLRIISVHEIFSVYNLLLEWFKWPAALVFEEKKAHALYYLRLICQTVLIHQCDEITQKDSLLITYWAERHLETQRFSFCYFFFSSQFNEVKAMYVL